MRYYSVMRPVTPGSYPKRDKVKQIVNFDSRQFCEDIGREAWGYIEYSEALSDAEIYEYELVNGDLKPFWSVMIQVNHRTNKSIAILKEKRLATSKPCDEVCDIKNRTVILKWFDNFEEAENKLKIYK